MRGRHSLGHGFDLLGSYFSGQYFMAQGILFAFNLSKIAKLHIIVVSCCCSLASSHSRQTKLLTCDNNLLRGSSKGCFHTILVTFVRAGDMYPSFLGDFKLSRIS